MVLHSTAYPHTYLMLAHIRLGTARVGRESVRIAWLSGDVWMLSLRVGIYGKVSEWMIWNGGD